MAVFGSLACSVAESITLTAAGESNTSLTVRVAVMVTCPSDVTRPRAESARDAESRGDGAWAETRDASSASAKPDAAMPFERGI